MSETVVSSLSPKPQKRAAYTLEFEAFWRAYPSTIGQSKPNGFKAWQRLGADDQAMAMASLDAYRQLLKGSPDRPVKHVQGYLNGRMFESFQTGPTDEDEAAKRLAWGREHRQWPVKAWGPMPGHDGCRVPPSLLAAGDGDGWTEYDPRRHAA